MKKNLASWNGFMGRSEEQGFFFARRPANEITGNEFPAA